MKRYNRTPKGKAFEEDWQGLEKRRIRQDGTDEVQDIADIMSKIGRTNRHLSTSYVAKAQSSTTQAVVKIVSAARGGGSVDKLFKYISRAVEYSTNGDQNDREPELELEDEQGNIITTKAQQEAILAEWMKDSDTAAVYKKQAWKQEKIDQLDRERYQLTHKTEQGQATTKDQERLAELNLALKTFRYKEPARTLDLTDPANADRKKALQRQYHAAKSKKNPTPWDEKRTAQLKKALDSGVEETPARVIDLRVKAPDDAMHILLSVGGQGHNLENAKQAARQYLDENFASAGHRYTWTMHTDTDNLHFHVVLKMKSDVTKNQIHLNKDDLFHLRQDFAYQLNKQKIEPRTSTLRQDRIVTVESLQKQTHDLYQRRDWYEEKVDKARPVDAFGYRDNALKQTERLLLITQNERKKLIQGNDRRDQLKNLEDGLRAHKEQLLNFTGPKVAKQAELTVQKLEQDNKELVEKGRALLNLNPNGSGGGGSKKRRNDNQAKYLEAHRKDLQRAIGAMTEASKHMQPHEREAVKIQIETLKKLDKASKPKGFRLGF